VQQVHTAEGATEAVGARDDRRRYGSCRRVRRPAALRKLSARETTGRATEAAGAGQAGPARSETSGASHRTSDASAGQAGPARSETSGASHRTSDASAGQAGPARSETSGASHRTSDASAGRARPARSETSGAGHRTSDASAGRAETGRQGETSGESCRTSQKPAVPRDKCERRFRATSASSGSARRVRAAVPRDECEQRFRATSASSGSARRVRAAVPRDECEPRFCATSASSGSARRVRAAVQRDKCEQRFRATSASRSGSVIRGGARGASARGESQNFGWRPVRAARRSSRTAECGRPPCAEVAFSGIKGGGAFWILQSRRSEHPYGGNCTERHRTRTTAGGAAYAVPCESTRT
jgi:hypothetical protein